jgi:hypothetical protein
VVVVSVRGFGGGDWQLEKIAAIARIASERPSVSFTYQSDPRRAVCKCWVFDTAVKRNKFMKQQL